MEPDTAGERMSTGRWGTPSKPTSGAWRREWLLLADRAQSLPFTQLETGNFYWRLPAASALYAESASAGCSQLEFPVSSWCRWSVKHKRPRSIERGLSHSVSGSLDTALTRGSVVETQ